MMGAMPTALRGHVYIPRHSHAKPWMAPIVQNSKHIRADVAGAGRDLGRFHVRGPRAVRTVRPHCAAVDSGPNASSKSPPS